MRTHVSAQTALLRPVCLWHPAVVHINGKHSKINSFELLAADTSLPAAGTRGWFWHPSRGSKVRQDKSMSGCIWGCGSDAWSAVASHARLGPPWGGCSPSALGGCWQGGLGHAGLSPSLAQRDRAHGCVWGCFSLTSRDEEISQSVKIQPCDYLQFLAFWYFTKPKLHPEVIPAYEWVKIQAGGDIKRCVSQKPSYCSQLWKKTKTFIAYAIRPLLTFYFCIIFFPPAKEQKQAEHDPSHFYKESQTSDAQFSVATWEGWAKGMTCIIWRWLQVHPTRSGSFH